MSSSAASPDAEPFGSGQIRTAIVGVVGDVRHVAPDKPPMPEVFRPLSQVFMMPMAVAIRSNGPPEQLAAAARAAVWLPARRAAHIDPVSAIRG